MMDDLQQAYSAYQQALYHLSDPKVTLLFPFRVRASLTTLLGTQALVWHWHIIRSVWLARARRGSFLSGHAHGAQF